jgi:hypothetical protein
VEELQVAAAVEVVVEAVAEAAQQPRRHPHLIGLMEGSC